MYKKIFTIFALAASLLACNKVENEAVAPETGAKTLTITATIGDPTTRLSYSEAEDGSYKARFNDNDVIWAYFAKPDNTVAGDVAKLEIDPKTISFDGKSACFRQPGVTIPEGASKIIAYLSNTANTTNFNGGDDIISDISSQANLTAALNNQVIYGAVNFSDLTSSDPDALAASIPFSYKTSLIKFSLALPEGTEVDPAAAVSVALTGGKIHNKLHISGGVLGAKSEEGDLSLGATLANGVVSASAAVWAEDDLTSNISVTVGEDTYFVEFKPAAAIVAGKVYTVERTIALSPKPVTMWANDDAASADFKYSGGEEVTNDWLSCKDGKVSWTANTTGAPRTAKLSFKNGASFELTQLTAADFKGNYSFTAKIFNNEGSSFVTAGDKKSVNVKIGDPLKGETLKDGAGVEHVNVLGVDGLYHAGLIADAAVEIDYAAQTAKFGLFADARKAQKDPSPVSAASPYVAFLPELGSVWTAPNGFDKPWFFCAADLGDPDYEWIWFDVAADLKSFSYTANKPQQIVTSNPNNYGKYIIGLSVNTFTAEDATFANLAAGKTMTNGYNIIYQFNTNNSNVGMLFERK